MNKKLMTVCILSALSVQLLACGDSSAKTTETETDVTADPTTETVTAVQDSPVFPFPAEDHGGQNFHILVPSEKASEFVSETTGDIMNDTLYQRNLDVAEHFNINFTFQYESGDYPTRHEYTNVISRTVLAGDPAYDLATGLIVCVLPAFSSDIFVNLSDCRDLDFDHPWWIEEMEQNLSIGDHQIFCAIGDGCLSTYRDCSVCYFNKTLLDEYHLENPYDLVAEDAWTLDKFKEMASQISVDLNQDGKIYYKDDKLGYYSQCVPYRTWQTALEIKVFDLDENQNRILMPLDERMVNALSFMQDFAQQNYFDYIFKHPGHAELARPLAEDRALFFTSFIYVMEDAIMRDMKSDFGIVPFPKFDKEQKQYHTQMGTSTNVMFIPKSAKDIDLTCRVMEALSYYGQKDVVPVYYETALADKYTRDPQALDMLHLIRQSMSMDFTFAYSTAFDPFPNSLMEYLVDKSYNIVSFYESNKKGWESQLKKMNEFQSGSVLD